MSANETTVRWKWSRSAMWTFAGTSSAEAAIEYALLLALCVGGGVASYYLVAVSADRAFSSAAGGLAQGTPLEDRTTSTLIDLPSSRPRGGEHWNRLLAWLPGGMHVSATIPWVLLWATAVTTVVTIWHSRRRRTRNLLCEAGGCPVVAPLQPGDKERLIEKRQQIRRLLSHKLDDVLGLDTDVRYLMSRRAVTIGPGESRKNVAEKMRGGNIRHLLVCGKRGELLGVISDRDVSQRAGETARDIMTTAPVVVSPDTAVGPAITIMLNRGFSCLPVVHHGALSGVLTTTDLMLTLQCVLQLVNVHTSRMTPDIGDDGV